MQSKKTNTSYLYLPILVILLALGIVFFVRSSVFSIKKVSVTGLQGIPEVEIQRLADVALGQNLLLLDEQSLRSKLELYPLVQDVVFQRKLPDTLNVKVQERMPSALVIVSKGVVEVDSKGVFLRRLESWPKTDFPVIEGITVPDTAGPGQVISSPQLAAALNLLGQAPSALLPQIGELSVSPIDQMTIFLTSGVEVRLGQANQWKDKLTALLDLLNDKGYQSFQQEVTYIDFTAAKPVIGKN